MHAHLDRLRTLLFRVKDLSSAAEILSWDQETYMPDGAAQARAHQITTLRTLAHEYFTADEVGTLLDALADDVASLDPLSNEASLVRITKRDYEQALRLPTSLVTAFAEAVAHAKVAWRAARETDDFSAFAPHLERIVELNIEKAEALGYDDRLYDALLDQFEPGMQTAAVESVFDDLRARLTNIVHTIAEQPAPEDAFLHLPYDQQKQWDFGMAVLRDFGYDFNRGRQDLSAHPFTTSFSISDVRLTTRINETFLPSGLFGTMHECGHGLYEQGIDPALDRTPLADGTSLGMHESQSRLWENLIGRSRAFWEHYYPLLKSTFPDQLGDVPLDAFYRAINRVEPSLIRVEADEVTYNLHIMLRFELENAMLEQRVTVDELPELWNAKMEEYFGIRPDSDANGVLQDIHWSLGTIGYFPTYALGNLMSVQIFNVAQDALPHFEAQICSGKFRPLRAWLQENIHQHGRKLQAPDLLKRVTGESLAAEPWLAYIRAKYGALYEGL